MADEIEINVSFTGTEQAVTGTAAVSRGIEAMGDASADAARQQQLAATQAIAFGQRIAGAANAVQSLVSQLGGQNRTAGLIGATINSATQFAQLGAALGPGGALVGGIVGSLIPAIRELIEAQDAAAQSARALQHEEELLTERGQRMAEERRQQVQREVESGQILTLSEEEISRATALAAERRAEVYRNLQTVVVALQRAEEQGMDHTSGRFQEWTERAATLRSELREVTTQINALDQATLSRGLAESADENAASSTRASGRGGSRGMSDEKTNVLAKQEEIRERMAAAEQQRAEDEAERRAEVIAAIDREVEAERHLHEERLRIHEEDLQADAEAMQAQMDQLNAHNEAVKAAAQEQAQATTEEINNTFSSIIGSMTEVISQIAEGNATAEEGAQMMLAAFLEALSQRAQIEALAQVAQAIGSYPDVAGIAAHAAAALAWGAVAVATGVGSSAISSGVSKAQAARAEAERPASPRSEAVSKGGGAGTTVINFNGPVMTAQGEATFGRMLNRVGSRARDRFPGDG